MARGEVIGCFGLTEPDFGSNPGGMITRAVQDGDGWVLNGAKMWITNGSTADIAIVWAKTGELDDVEVHPRLHRPHDTPGFTARRPEGEALPARLRHLRAGAAGRARARRRPPPGSGGLKSPLMCLTQARYGIAWGAVGAAMACLRRGAQLREERGSSSPPIAATQIQQVRLAEMLTEITKAQLLCLAARPMLKDAGKMRPSRCRSPSATTWTWREVAREARRLLGANGILVEYQSMRHMANLESVYTYEGTHDVHGLILGQEITGHAAY
jgi:glutaryl-CoA dehydrogenase